MVKRHTHAKGLVNDAAERLRSPTYHTELEAMSEKDLRIYIVTLLEQQTVVSGAVLEEVSSGGNRVSGTVTIIINKKVLGLIGADLFTLASGLVAYFKRA
ncbi:MAG: hypothetical protein BZY81_06355 [SAR202 cluster bacterium Io17-Chloro-G4]|nr:MAG: hypothetical protein BZY81_06355 [SAR202 cluster bacterium Io17-Chloro-G4]